MAKQKFTRRIYTSRVFFGDIGFMFSHASKIRKARKNPIINKQFIERIMTVSTAVNGCVYCEWFHVKEAAASGISEQEIKNMMNLQFQTEAPDFELPALEYTQHYAETGRHPDPEMTKRFYDFYGEKDASDIFLFIRMINFGNLTGNTWDAVRSRLHGNPAENSNVFFELLFGVMMFPFMYPIMKKMQKENKK